VINQGHNFRPACLPSALLNGCGVTDFAGSGVVHMTGGVAALVGCIAVGPRAGRFENGAVHEIKGQSIIFQTLGTLILWMGWYGFNGASTLYITAYGGVAAHTMVTTTISAATGCLATTLLGYCLTGVVDPADANNSQRLQGGVGIDDALAEIRISNVKRRLRKI
jgi:Amt family ammonium transporter